MATLSDITPDMVQDAIDQLEDVSQKHSAWLGERIDDMVEIIKNAPDGDVARQDFLNFCKTSPFNGDLKVVGRLVDVLGLNVDID